MNIAEYSIRNSVVTWVVTIALLVVGYMSFQQLSRLEDPEFTIKDAIVLTPYPGASPQEVEEEVTQLKDRAVVDAAAEVAEIAEQTKGDEEKFLQRVNDEISRREAETRVRLAQDTADLTAQLARELLEREMTDDDRRRVFERSLAAMQGLEGKE